MQRNWPSAAILRFSCNATAAPAAVVPANALGLGGCFTRGLTHPRDNTGDADEANVWGAFMTLVAHLVAATGPVAVGALRDVTHGFGAALWLLVAAGTVMVGVTPFLQPNRDRLRRD